MRRKLAAGNWKMNGTRADWDQVQPIVDIAVDDPEIVMCIPAVLITEFSVRSRGAISIGGQDCHANDAGAHTGDLSAHQLQDAGATYVVLGHSERRADHGETDALIASKARAAYRVDLKAIICIGESEAERDAGTTLDVIGAQLDASVPDEARGNTTVIAYEPIWAIGTGKVPTLEQIAEVHDFIRSRMTERFGEATANTMRLLYGGSVKPSNAADIFAVSNVDGALVGGASLKSEDFAPIVQALESA